jgi:hypothetical protein
MATKILPGTFEVTIFSQKRSNYHISLWRKVFFLFLTNVFFIHIKVAQCCQESPKKNKKNGRLLGTWYLGVFQKKLGTKLFIVTVKKNFTLIFFYLVLALESISGVKRGLLCQTPLNIFFSQKLSNYHISLWRKVFFPILTNFFFIHIKVAQCCEESPKKNKKNGRFLGTWYLGVFQKKLGTKLFIFTVKKKIHINLFLLSFGPRVHFRSQTWTFWSNTPEYKFQSKTVKLSHFTLEKSIFSHF